MFELIQKVMENPTIAIPLIGPAVVLLSSFFGLFTGIFRLFVKPFRLKTYLLGQWQGTIGADGILHLHCELTIYLRNGELMGGLFYDGKRGDNFITGFDRLENDSDKIECIRRKKIPSPPFNIFNIKMSRDVHHDPNLINQPVGMPEIYDYQFEVLRRYRPRMRCTVMTKADSDGTVHVLSGQFSRPKGG